MLTEEEGVALLQEMEETLKNLRIPISGKIAPKLQVNFRAKRRLGCCVLKSGVYSIEVSASLLGRPELLRQTIAHELLHTCKGCGNHGTLWKAYAARVNEALGYSVQRLTPADPQDSAPLRTEEVKYVLLCTSCGAKIPRCRMSKVVKYPWRYRCKCGGKLKRIA